MRATALVALALVLVAFFAPLALGKGALVFRDLVVYAAPQDAALREAIVERRELPARNPYLYGGVALLADPSAQALYPPRVACALAFSQPRSLHVYAFLHVLVAALGARALGRSLGASSIAASAGGIVYALSGPVLSLLENPPLLAGAAWLPWALALAARGRVAWSGLAIAACALGGDLQATTWSALGALGLVAWRARREPVRALAGVVPGVLGLVLAGALLVPAVLLRPETDRAHVDEERAGAWSLAPARLVELAVPFPWGHTFPDRRDQVVDGLEAEGSSVHEPWSETIHVGIAALAVAFLARRGRIALALALGALVLAMGPRAPLWGVARAVVPFYSVYRHPEKHAVLAALALAAGAALGIDRVRRVRPGAALALLGAGLLVIATGFATEGLIAHSLGSVVRASHFHPAAHEKELARRIAHEELPRAGVVLVALGGLALLAKKRRRLAHVLVALLVAADVASALRARLFLGDATLYDEHPLGVERVRASGAKLLRWPFVGGVPLGRVPTEAEMPGRSLEERAIAARVRSWTASVAARERVPAVSGMTSFEPSWVSEKLPPALVPKSATLDELGVRWLVLDAKVAAHEGLAPVLSSDQGVALIDRGERIAPAAPPSFNGASFSGDVPGLAPGVALSVAGVVGFVFLRRRRVA